MSKSRLGPSLFIAMLTLFSIGVQAESGSMLSMCLNRINSEDARSYAKECLNCQVAAQSVDAEGSFAGIQKFYQDCNDRTLSWCIAFKCGKELCGETFGDKCPKESADKENKTGTPDPVAKAAPKAEPAPKAAPANPAKPGTENTTPQSNEQCDAAAKAAQNCCENPSTCGGSLQTASTGPLPGQSMTDYCKQMDASSADNIRANNAAGSACLQRIATCKTTCNNAGDSETANGCGSLTAKAQSMGKQGLASSTTGMSGDACKNLSQAQQQSTGPGGGMPNMPNQNNNDPNKNASNDPNDPSGCKNNPTGAQCQRCTANPNDPSCGTAMQKGQSAFSDNSDKPTDKSGFDIPTPTSASHSMFDQASIPTGQAPKNGTIANNSGGGIPGQGGGGGGAANLGGNGQKKVVGGGSGVSTDILQGNMPGGYTSPGGSAETDGGGGGWGGYGGRMPASASGTGMDLKQFLPGQKKAPAFVGGAYSMQSAEIAGKHGDIFEKITRKFHEKCLQGQLIGCDR